MEAFKAFVRTLNRAIIVRVCGSFFLAETPSAPATTANQETRAKSEKDQSPLPGGISKQMKLKLDHNAAKCQGLAGGG